MVQESGRHSGSLGVALTAGLEVEVFKGAPEPEPYSSPSEVFVLFLDDISRLMTINFGEAIANRGRSCQSSNIVEFGLEFECWIRDQVGGS